MLAIQHNVGAVLAEFEAMPAQIEAAVRRSIEPGSWLVVARKDAEEILRVMVDDPAEERLIPGFVRTVATRFLGDGMAWSMESVSQSAINILAAVQQEQLGPLLKLGNQERVDRVAELVEDWVRNVKHKDERDQGLSDAEIAKRILNILFGSRTEGRVTATAALLPHLQKFATEAVAGGLSPERASLWLLAVLNAWTERILADVPRRIAREIHQILK